MRRLFPVVVLFFILFSSSTQAQLFKGFGSLGLNLSQVDGDEVYGYKKAGLHAGLGVMMSPYKNWDVSLETNFTQKGARQRVQYPLDSLNGAYRLSLDYLEVPVLVYYTDKDFVTVGTGFSWGRLVRAEEWEHEKKTATTAQNGVYSTNDFDVLIDLKMKMSRKFSFNFRYSYSMAKIRTREFIRLDGSSNVRQQYNNMLTFRLVYFFNKDEAQRVKDEDKMKKATGN